MRRRSGVCRKMGQFIILQATRTTRASISLQFLNIATRLAGCSSSVITHKLKCCNNACLSSTRLLGGLNLASNTYRNMLHNLLVSLLPALFASARYSPDTRARSELRDRVAPRLELLSDCHLPACSLRLHCCKRVPKNLQCSA